MKNKVIWLGLSFLMLAAMLLASCATSTTTSKPTSSTTSTLTTTSTTTKTTTHAAPTAPPTTNTTTTVTGNWWDKLGTPQYGGEITLRVNADVANFDPYFSATMSLKAGWMEKLFEDDWTLNPTVFAYQLNFRTSDYAKGCLAESWAFTDPSTFVIHLRQGIHWQNIQPANGRELTADDIAFHFDRMYGLGGGFTKPSPYASSVVAYSALLSVTATDKYTIVFKWKTPNQENILENLQSPGGDQFIECPDAVNLWGDIRDWHHAIGTGPFILTDFVSAGSMILKKNPNYWGNDERYPQNKIPYIDTLNVLIIPDNTTALAAVRTGKIDALDGIQIQDSQQMQKTNPQILQIAIPQANTPTVNPRNDKTPYNDIRVREALQMAIDLPNIANTYYAGTCPPYPSGLTSGNMKGWGFPYDQWPQDLKDEYAYNPKNAQQLLVAAGYPNGFKTNVVADAAADLNLLQIVKSYFAQVGVDMDIRVMDSTSFLAFVVNGHNHDQLAFRANGTLGVTYEPLRQLQNFISTNAGDYAMVRDPAIDTFNTQAIAATSVDEVKKILADANQYITRQHLVVSLLQPNLFGLYQSWLKGYNGQNGSISASSGGPTYLGFYAARFWIDQKLKKSLGH